MLEPDVVRSPSKRERLLGEIERYTEWPLLVLSVVFATALLAPIAVELSPQWVQFTDGVELVIWAIFALDLGIKTAISERRLAYLRTHWFEVLIVALPFFRPLRLLRVVFVGIYIWRRWANVIVKRGLHKALLVIGILVLISAALVVLFEQGEEAGTIATFGDAIWWALVTITTVGYGDEFPVTLQGRIIGVFLMGLGITLFSLVTANLAAFFLETDPDDSDKNEVRDRLARIEASFDRIERLLVAASADESASTTGEGDPPRNSKAAASGDSR